MSSSTSTRRGFELTIELDASVEDVWRALTTGEELARWFPLEARVEPGLDGSVFVSWGADCEGTAPITIWEPNRHFQWTEKMPAPGSGEGAEPVPIYVDYFLEEKGGKTGLRLVHSGFGEQAAWDDYYDSISRGWKFELRGLRHYLRYHKGKDRRVVWARQETKLSAEETAKRVLGEHGRVLVGQLEGLAEGDRYRLGSAGDAGSHLEGIVQVNRWPKSFAATVSNLNESYFRFEIERMGGGLEAWLWLSTYDMAPAAFDAIEARWKRALSEALS